MKTKPAGERKSAKARLAGLEDTLAHVRLEQGEINGLAGPHLIVEGCNLHVRNATGATEGIDGLGNLIVGHNEESFRLEERTGSHNLVVGREHTYSSFGGFVAGFRNDVTGREATVSGGWLNEASGDGASVSGGVENLASSATATVSGGRLNVASGGIASVSGGRSNVASGGSASVSGGESNVASGVLAVVSGGSDNEASGISATVSGGELEVADQQDQHKP